MPVEARAEVIIRRLDAAEQRVLSLSGRDRPAALTAPDPQTGERWGAGQVWAHLAEFIPYWTGELRKVLVASSRTPVPFGRVKSDRARLAAIEADCARPPEELAARVSAALKKLRALLRELPASAFSARGQHQTLGLMDVQRIVEEFLAGHLEEHALQLELLYGEVRTA